MILTLSVTIVKSSLGTLHYQNGMELSENGMARCNSIDCEFRYLNILLPNYKIQNSFSRITYVAMQNNLYVVKVSVLIAK